MNDLLSDIDLTVLPDVIVYYLSQIESIITQIPESYQGLIEIPIQEWSDRVSIKFNSLDEIFVNESVECLRTFHDINDYLITIEYVEINVEVLGKFLEAVEIMSSQKWSEYGEMTETLFNNMRTYHEKSECILKPVLKRNAKNA